MRGFDPVLSEEFAKEVFKFFLLLEIGFSTTRRITDCDIPIYYGGNRYDPVGFTLDAVTLSATMSVDRVGFEIDDTNLAFTSDVLGEDVRGAAIIFSVGALDAGLAVLGVEEIFRGDVGGWDLREGILRLTCANEFIRWRKKALRTASATCPWVFKGEECTYGGDMSWCDQSWERCNTPGNKDNYGGFRFLPSIMEKEIWWGRVPK